MRKALFQERLAEEYVLCTLCPHDCKLKPKQRGACGVRINLEGQLYTLVADRIVSSHADPVEKKPLFHFKPGSRAYSIATVGCNLRCWFCQNWEISQGAKGKPKEPPDPFCPSVSETPEAWILGRYVSPNRIVEEARTFGCSSIAYTYTEPTVFYELALETAKVAKGAGLANIFVTNGYTSLAAIDMVAPWLDAVNVDLKSFRETFYRRICGAKLAPVLASIRRYRELGIWVEITTLLVPGYNDDEEQLRDIASFIYDEVGDDVPWHISRFFPAYKMKDVAVTSESKMREAESIGREAGLRYVYLGNVIADESESTKCPECEGRLVQRAGFTLLENRLADGSCPDCGARIAGIWN